MPTPADFPWRGCAANFQMPLNEDEEEAAQGLVDIVHSVNCVEEKPCLVGIQYRGGFRYDCDIIRSVFRWDTRPYQEIFQNGFQTNPIPGKSSAYNLYDFAKNAGAPLGEHRPRRHAFVSTTISRGWVPQPDVDTLPGGKQMQVYRYEIYAPGGIWVRLSLGNGCEPTNTTSHDEVCFVGGIAPHYIRSAQRFILTREEYDPHQRPPSARWRRVHNRLTINGNFNPFLHEDEKIRLQGLVNCFRDENRVERPLKFHTYMPKPRRQKRQVSSDKWDAAVRKWYAGCVAEVPSYIDAAFRASITNGVYIFMKNEYVLLNYAPGSCYDLSMEGPLLICDGFSSLIGTPFGEHGIDCAFDTNYLEEAFIFSANLCANIAYASMTNKDKILSGPMTITAMFPFFDGTVFEDGIDAAFKATRSGEAYLFRGDQCAHINYVSMNLIHVMNINDTFPCLLGTVFESGIDAAFTSHRKPEAYLFKGAYYALMNFAPGKTDAFIVDSRIKRILDSWPSLGTMLPHKNNGLDVHDRHAKNS